MGWPLTDEQKQSMSEEDRLFVQLLEAKERGDDDEAFRLRQQITYPPEALMAWKNMSGKEAILKRGLKTDHMEAIYGKDWLDR